jgi:hypothetical protein
MKWLNDQPFEHICKRGFVARATRCDLKGGVTLIVPQGAQLNGFAGYDTVHIAIVEALSP